MLKYFYSYLLLLTLSLVLSLNALANGDEIELKVRDLYQKNLSGRDVANTNEAPAFSPQDLVELQKQTALLKEKQLAAQKALEELDKE